MPRVKAFHIFALLLVIGCDQKSLTETPGDPKPNIIFILIDDLGKEWISSYGAENIRTPNIDALAAAGTKFNNVYCMPQCTPSRVTFLTGQYPYRHGWVNHWDVPRWGGGAHFDESLNPSVGLELKKAGYMTCIAGKWQIDDFRVEPKSLTNNGFDAYCMWTGYETGIPASAERYQDPYLFTSDGSQTYQDQFGPDVFNEFIKSFITTYRDSSFFVYYPMVLTHTPFVNTPNSKAENDLDRHKAMVDYTDKMVGKIVSLIDALEIRDNTLIILTTDNGTSRQISGLRNGKMVKGAKSQLSEAGVCVPFIASWPNQLKSNAISEALIDFSDLYPTLIDLANSEVGSSSQVIDGKSFKKVLTDNQPHSDRSWIMSMGGGNYARLTENGVENQYVFRDRVIRNERYKIYIDTEGNPDQFYDLQEDPWEQFDLIDSLENPDIEGPYKELYQVLTGFPEMDNDPLYTPNPPQSWDVGVTAKSQQWKL